MVTSRPSGHLHALWDELRRPGDQRPDRFRPDNIISLPAPLDPPLPDQRLAVHFTLCAGLGCSSRRVVPPRPLPGGATGTGWRQDMVARLPHPGGRDGRRPEADTVETREGGRHPDSERQRRPGPDPRAGGDRPTHAGARLLLPRPLRDGRMQHHRPDREPVDQPGRRRHLHGGLEPAGLEESITCYAGSPETATASSPSWADRRPSSRSACSRCPRPRRRRPAGLRRPPVFTASTPCPTTRRYRTTSWRLHRPRQDRPRRQRAGESEGTEAEGAAAAEAGHQDDQGPHQDGDVRPDGCGLRGAALHRVFGALIEGLKLNESGSGPTARSPSDTTVAAHLEAGSYRLTYTGGIEFGHRPGYAGYPRPHARVSSSRSLHAQGSASSRCP